MARRAFALVYVLDVNDDELEEEAGPLYYGQSGAELLKVDGIDVVSMESVEIELLDGRDLTAATGRAVALLGEV